MRARLFCCGFLVVALAGVGSVSAGAGDRPGDVDGTFGTAGVVTAPLAAYEVVDVGSDGKIVVAGTDSVCGGVARLEPSGAVDTGFGTAGVVDVAAATGLVDACEFLDLRVLSDGSTVVVVSGNTVVGDPFTRRLYGLKLTASGALDPLYGGGSGLLADLGFVNSNNDAHIAADGAIAFVAQGSGVPPNSFAQTFSPAGVAEGSGFGFSLEAGEVVSGCISLGYSVLATVRLPGDVLVSSGGTIVVGDPPCPDFVDRTVVSAQSITDGSLLWNVVLPEGSVPELGVMEVVGGDVLLPVIGSESLLRVSPAGDLVGTWGTDGVAAAPFSLIGGLTELPGDRVGVVNGRVPQFSEPPETTLRVARLLGDGAADPNFATATFPLGRDLPVADVAGAPDGDLLVATGADLRRFLGRGYQAPLPDFDGDGAADRAVFRPEFGAWLSEPLFTGAITDFLGLPGDVPVPGDYDGDGVTERAVFRNGQWFVEGAATQFLGAAGDLPVPADYDGDGTIDLAVYRDGAWFVDGLAPAFFGLPTDVPVPGDYDNDGVAELAVFRPEVGGWYVDGLQPAFFGLSTDVPVPADYDGDGTVDLAVFRPEVGGWYVEGQATRFVGLSTDIPVPADYDGDQTAQPAVFRPEVGGWYVDGESTVFFGLNGDIPLSLPAAVHSTYYPPSP